MTSRMLFVDPGVNCPGVAIFEGELKRLTLPDWCDGLPLAATGGVGQNYGEAK